MPDSIQRSIPCQTSADGFRRLFGLACERFNLPVDLLVADLDVFLLGDFFQQQRCFHFLQRLIALTGPQPVEIHFLQIFLAHALRRQSAKPAIEPHINLTIHQGLRNFKIVALDQFVDQLVLGTVLGRVLALGFHAFADALPHHVHACELLAQFSGERVIQLGQRLLLQPQHLDCIVERLASQALVGRVLRIGNFEGALVARRGAAEIFRELGHGVLARDLHQDVVHVDRLAFAVLGLAVQGDLGEIAVGEGAAFDGTVGGMLLAEVVERLFDFLVADRNSGFIRAQLPVTLDLDLGHHFEAGLEPEGLAVMDMKVRHSRLGDGSQAQLVGLLTKVTGNQGVDHVGLDVFGKPLANDRRRYVSLAEAWQAGQLLILLNQSLSLACYSVRRNLDCDLSLGTGTSIGFGGTHIYLSAANRPRGFLTRTEWSKLSVKTDGEHRQTLKGSRWSSVAGRWPKWDRGLQVWYGPERYSADRIS